MSKRWKTPLLLLTLFAALGVMTRELPECLSLSDDVSNDGNVPVLCQKELLERVLAFETRESVSPACLAPSFRQRPYPAAMLGTPCVKSAKSLLNLLHVQRK